MRRDPIHKRIWRRYRSWPNWAQWTLAVFIGLMILGGVSSEPEEHSSRSATASPSPASKTDASGVATARSERSTDERKAARNAARRQAAAERRANARRHARSAVRAKRRHDALVEKQRREAEQESSCHPSYEGACLDPDASDYDCSGGSGDGPMYTGPVQMVGSDDFDLDRDGDGYACEG